jgi:hypothetical protein
MKQSIIDIGQIFSNYLYLKRIAIFWLNLDSDDVHDLSLLWTLAFVAISKFFKERNQKPFSEKNKENKNSFSFCQFSYKKEFLNKLSFWLTFEPKKKKVLSKVKMNVLFFVLYKLLRYTVNLVMIQITFILNINILHLIYFKFVLSMFNVLSTITSYLKQSTYLYV